MNTPSTEQVRQTVRAGYAAIAAGQQSSCCGWQRSNQAGPARLELAS